MATLIETEEAAKRLARVILSDVQLYNKDLIASGGDLKHALHEGRHHFKSRVIQRMYGVFDQVAIERKLLAGAVMAPEDGPPLEKTPAVLSSNDRPTPVSIAVKPLEAVTPVPAVPNEPTPAPVQEMTPPPAPAPRTSSVRPPPVTTKATPAARPVDKDPPMEKTPPPIPERAKPAPVQITITATPPPPPPIQLPWPPATSAPQFTAAEQDAPHVSGFAESSLHAAMSLDSVIPNLKPPFPWIRIILLIAAAVGAVAAVVRLTR